MTRKEAEFVLRCPTCGDVDSVRFENIGHCPDSWHKTNRSVISGILNVDWAKAYREEVRDSDDPLVRAANRIVYHCACNREYLHNDRHYVMAVRNTAQIIKEFLEDQK